MDPSEIELLDAIQIPVFVLEPDDRGRPVYVHFNRQACRVAEVELADVTGRTAREVYSGRSGEIAYRHHVEALETGQPSTYELVLQLRSNELRARTTLQPVRDTRGRVVRVVATSSEISAEIRGREMQAEADAVLQEVSDFVSLAAHDLRSPMLSVRSIAELLRSEEDVAGEDAVMLIDALEDLTARALSTITDVLDHAHTVGLGRETIDEFDFGEICGAIAVVLDPHEMHELVFERCRLRSDRTVLQIVLRNLVDNAIKHGGENVRVEITLAEPEDGTLEIRVRDHGRGFEDPSMIFLDGGRLTSSSGFGLLGVRRLLRARGGSIRAEQAPDGSGAVFIFALPGTIVGQLADRLPTAESARRD